jgi:hypothetical protein
VLHLLAFARPVLAVLDQIEHTSHSGPVEHRHVLAVERVAADQQTIDDIGEAVSAKPHGHPEQ